MKELRMTKQLTQEDKKFIKDFFEKIKNNLSISGETTLNKIGECISKMPIGDIQRFGKLFKTYGYYGVMFAVKESLENGTGKPLYKYAIATALVMMFPAGATVLSATLYASAIGCLVGVTWDYIEENKDDLYNKLKELLHAAGIDFDDDGNVSSDLGSFYNICPFPPREETICSIKERWDVGQCTRSPLVLDLDGNGINTLSTSAGVFFDHDANGFAENTAWVGQGDGILVRDLNNNGRIDNGRELFGNNTVLPDGTKAANGFEALRALDSNNDGLFNAEDTAWNEVKIWQDSNSDGKTDDGEIKSLNGAGVSSINLNDTEQDITDENGNRHKQTSVFINKEGAANTISDIWFAVNTTNTIDLSDVTISESISELPDIEGSGNVHSLHIAMALDTSGQLQQAVTNFINEQQPQNRRNMINEIVYRWTGVYDMDQDGRNPSHTYGNVLGDCRKLEALERFLGTEYRGIWCDETYDRNPHGQAAPYILEAFELLADFVWYRLSAQSTYKELLSKVLLYWNNSEQKWQIDVSAAVELLRAQYIANQSATSENMTNLAKYLAMSKLETADEIIAAFAAQGNSEGDLFERELATFGTKIGGNDGNDIFNGTEKSDFFNGKGGNDRIWTWGGNDFLIGGRGDDILSGGEGSDTYYWNWGDGFDEIHDGSTISSDVNKVVFGEGITFDDLAFARDGNDLIVHVKGDQTQGFRIFYQFYSSDYGIDFFVFADGTSVNLRNFNFNFSFPAA